VDFKLNYLGFGVFFGFKEIMKNKCKERLDGRWNRWGARQAPKIHPF
jgi:hypothetical protein